MSFIKRDSYNVAIVGASGAVGQEFLRVLSEQNFPINELHLFGSQRSSGMEIEFEGKKYIVKELKDNDDFKGIDIAFVSAGGDTSINFAHTITKHGAIMIDNSSAFRMDRDVPLVVPEVNPNDAFNTPKNIIANPNCTTIQMVVTLSALNRLSKIKRVHVSTYQSASGAGAAAMNELEQQHSQIVNNEAVKTEKFAHQLAFNLIPQVDVFTDNGYTKEEMKMFNETRKIMHDDDISVSATCVRVPVMRAHSESIWVEFESEVTVSAAKEALSKAEGIILVDDTTQSLYPMPLHVAGEDPVYVGRVRADLSNPRGLTYWCVSDQIKKGAALNAVQIAQVLISK